MSYPSRDATAQPLVACRLIAVAMLLGGIVAGVVGVIVSLGGDGRPTGGTTATILFGAWVALAIACAAGWWIVFRRASEIAESPRSEMDSARDARVLRLLVLGWALLEAQLMVALVASLLGGTPMLLIPGLTIFTLGLVLSFPKRAWFAARPGST